MMNRRRFLTVTAAATASLAAPAALAGPKQVWTGIALGARASIRLDHPDAGAIAARAAAEISRLEGVFSLFRVDSALSRLNAEGRLDAPPPELLECLALAGAVHRASSGAFDPTVQPLWALWAERAVAGTRPGAAELAMARDLGGWDALWLDETAITIAPGMGLTLNGIAQGFIGDRVAALLAAEGLTNILIDSGEFVALGQMPGGGAWPVRLAQGGTTDISNRALATSAPTGSVFDQDGRYGHILDPRTGEPAPARWAGISITAPSAALADALSTGACLMVDRPEIDTMAAEFGATCVSAVRA